MTPRPWVAVLVLAGSTAHAQERGQRIGGRAELMAHLASLEGADGSRPQVWFEDRAAEQALSFALREARAIDGAVVAQVVPEDMAESPCRLALSRDPDLVWVVRPVGLCQTRVVTAPPPPPVPIEPWLQGGLGLWVGNRGAGPGLAVAAGLARDDGVAVELGARIWAHTEVAPDRRWTGGSEALIRAGETGFVELGAGAAVLWEHRRPCSTCEAEVRGPLWGPAFTGAVGLSGTVGQLDLAGAVRARSLPGRTFAVGLELVVTP